MAGFYTPGLPLAVNANFSAGAMVPVDTNLPNGVAPQSVKVPVSALGYIGAAQAITYATTTSFDASISSFFSLTFGAGNTTLTLSNVQPGQIIYGLVTQDSSGSRTLTVANGSGGTTIVSGTPLSTSASYVDLIAIMNVGTFSAPIYAVWPVAKHFV